MNVQDTIVAISSAAGAGAVGIVRLSGPRSLPLAAEVFSGARGPLQAAEAFAWADGVVEFSVGAGAAAALPCRAYVFREPRSFTRQDVVELHLPGSPAALCALLDHLVHRGARRAQAGEFTARAFFSGRLDLCAAQAVADVIDAASDAQLRSAIGALGGQITRRCAAVADQIANVLAGAEAAIDLAEEQIELDSPAELSNRLADAIAQLHRLADQAADMPEVAHLPRVVLCGRPNAGKSSLLNAMAGEDRAIISPQPGTTRDVLGATLYLAGHAVVLQDAAGLHGQEVRSDAVRRSCGEPLTGPLQTGLPVTQGAFPSPATDALLAQAADRAARNAIAAADLLVLVADLADVGDLCPIEQIAALARQSNPRAPMLLAANKADLLDPDARARRAEELRSALRLATVMTSATLGWGLQELATELAANLQLSASRGGEALGLHQWQKRCLIEAAAAVQNAREILRHCSQVADQAELVAVELRSALAHLGQISGQVASEDILGIIFSRFCVGK